MPLHSLQIEKHALGGLIQHQDLVAEIEGFVTEYQFVAQPHSTIFSCLVNSYLAKEKIDKVMLAQKIKNLGISFKDNINIFDYIESISFAPITRDATLKACKELAKLYAMREVKAACDEIYGHLEKSINQPFDKTVGEIDAIYGKKMASFTTEVDEDQNMYARLLDLAEERGNNPMTEIGYATPWPEFNRLYGGFRRKNLYIFAARAKAGKSTLLNEIAAGLSKLHKMPILYLDTEMSTEETMFRAAAAQSGVPMWYIETGNWRKNPDYVKKIRTKLKELGQDINVTHKYVGNMSIEQIASYVRRWKLRVVGRDNPCVLIYDYIKIVGSDGNRQEYQEMGDRVDFLKKLAQELDIPILTACQNNREGVVGVRDPSEIVDDERSIGISDRITHYASVVWIFRRRVPEEVVLDTPESGSHKLIEVVCRHQGRDATGHQNLVRRTFPNGKTKYVQNFINFDIVNFHVEERGSLADTIQRQNSQFRIVDPQGQVNETL